MDEYMWRTWLANDAKEYPTLASDPTLEIVPRFPALK
jgi:hypothetical protein